MPLQITTTSPQELYDSLLAQTQTTREPSYLIFYASLTGPNNTMWCSDCRDAEPLINERFDGVDRPVLSVMYAGAKEEFKSPTNIWRAAPFYVIAVPTLFKVTVEGGLERLVEEDVYDVAKLDAFLKK